MPLSTVIIRLTPSSLSSSTIRLLIPYPSDILLGILYVTLIPRRLNVLIRIVVDIIPSTS